MSLLLTATHFQSFDDNGDPNSSGTLEFFEVGTATAKEVFNDKGLSSSAGTIVTLGDDGRATVFLIDEDYKVIEKDSSGNIINTQDGGINPQPSITSGSYNLIVNGSYEDDLDNDGKPDNWTIDVEPGGTQTIDTSTQQHGTQSIKYTSGGSGGGYHISKDYFPVSLNKSYFVEFALKSSVVNIRNLVQIKWYTAAKALISTTAVYDESAANPTSWTAKQSIVTPPATARFAKTESYGAHSSNSTAGTVWFDELSFIEIRQNINLGSDVASASTLTIPDGIQYVDVTGNSPITLISSNENYVKLHFDGALTLTHHATNLILPGAANITTVAGDEAEFIQYAADDWRCVNYQRATGVPNFASQMGGEYIKLSDVKSSGTDGGTFTSGSWQTRVLNTEDADTGNNCTLSANQFTLDAGTYIIRAIAPAFKVNGHKCKLRNVDDNTDVIIGTSEYSNGAAVTTTKSVLNGTFTISASKTFEFQHRSQSGVTSNGFGNNSNFSVNEIYSVVELIKVT